MKTKDEYIESLNAELLEWSNQIDVLTAKADHAAAHLKLKYAEDLAILRLKQQQANEKVTELQAASADAWESVKESADKVWEELKTGVNEATAKFK